MSFMKRYIFIPFLILFFVLPCFASAQTEIKSPLWKIFNLNIDISPKEEEGQKIKNREGVDIPSRRTMFSKTFINADGSFSDEIFLNPIHYQNDFGKWEPIDTSIVPSDISGYDYMNKTNLFKTYFTADPYGNKKNIKYQIGDASMEFTSLNEIKGENKNLNIQQLKQDFKDKRTRKLLGLFSAYVPRDGELGYISLKDENKLKYPKILDDVSTNKIDIDYSVQPTKLLEEIIVDRYGPITEIAQEFTLNNVYAKKEGAIINFYHSTTNNLLWHLSDPVMYEVNARIDKQVNEPSRFENHGLHYEIIDDNPKDNKLIIKKVLDQEGKDWLADKDRKFPVVIDATAEYDFSDSENNKAYYKKLDLPVNPADTTGEASSSDYTALATSDDSRWTTDDATTTGQYDSQIFKFKVNESENSINSIKAEWEGYGEIASGAYYTYLKIWDDEADSWTELQSIDFDAATDQTASGTISSSVGDYIDLSSYIYVLAASQKAKNLGEACSSADECTSGFCVDDVCCNNTCTGSTCQTCGALSSAGAGTCGYVNSNSEDPDGDCGTTGCYTGNCSGSEYTCGYYTSDEHNCAACTTCTGASSGSCVNITNDTQDSEGSNTCTATCKKCSSGSCVNQTSSQDLFDQCTASWNACADICTKMGPDGYCDGAGACDTNDARSCCGDEGSKKCSSGNCITGSCATRAVCNGCSCEIIECPFIYSWSGLEYIYDTQIIYTLDSKEKEKLRYEELSKVFEKNNQINLQIREEEIETSYIDYLFLEITDSKGIKEEKSNIFPDYASRDLDKLREIDGKYLITNYGDIVDLEFHNVPALKDGWIRKYRIAARGYYIYSKADNPFGKNIYKDIPAIPAVEHIYGGNISNIIPTERFWEHEFEKEEEIQEVIKEHNSLNTDYVKLTIDYTPNEAPSITSGPSDGDSTGASPTDVDSNVTFSATSSDALSDQWKLLVCSTSSAPTASTTTPTCAGGDENTWCLSSSWVNADTENTCTYTATSTDSESNDWYAFACDNNTGSPLCSTSSQGTGDSGSPFKVNHRPIDSAYYIDNGFYTYRKKLTINYTADGAQTNYQMKLLLGESSGASGEDVDCGSHIQTDFDDLRFTTSDEVTLIDYWIESITGTTPNQLATIWIEIPSIAADPDNTDIYMYYGNNDVSSASNGTNTFMYFDDFEWGSDSDKLDTGSKNWAVGTDDVAEIDIAKDIGDVSGYTGTRSGKWVGLNDNAPSAYASNVAIASTRAYSARFRVYKEDASQGIFIHGDGTRSIYCRMSTAEDIECYDGASYQDTGTNITADAWQLLEFNDIDFSNYTFDVWYNDSKIANDLNMRNAGGTQGANDLLFYGLGTTGADTWIDNVILRNWTTNEPTWASFGSEDTSNYFPSSYPTSLEAGNTITFGMGAHDDDTDTATDTVALLICKTSGVSGTTCDGGASDTWCGLSSATSSNPTCTSTASGLGSQTYYAYVFDNHSLGADINGASSTFTISNSVPSVGSITPGSVSLIESSTTTATSTCTVSDNNGCEDISSVVAVFYDDNAVDADCAADENNCYTGIACATTTCEGNNSDVLCTAYPYYYANASDWRWYVKVIDASSASSTNTSTTTKIDNLIAIDVSETDIDYGSIELSATSNQATTTIENTGNTNLDVGLYGTAMSCSLGTIAVGQQKFNIGGGETALTGVSQPVDLNVAQRTTTVPTGSIYWKLYAPSDGIAGTCSGTNTFEAANGG
jgi:hypothetical protein